MFKAQVFIPNLVRVTKFYIASGTILSDGQDSPLITTGTGQIILVIEKIIMYFFTIMIIITPNLK